MTTIPVNTTTSTINTTNTAANTTTAAKKDVMGKDDFLTLLVAQLKNQDPLSPDDPTAFTAQLAQFSSLEQLTDLNASMAGLTTAETNSSMLSSLSLIGKDISYNSGTLNFNGQPVELGYKLDGIASGVTLSIQDSNGKTIKTMQAADTELQAGNHFITWNGTDQNGNPVTNGKYNIVLQASAAGTNKTISATPLIKSVVTGVDLSNGTITTAAGDVLLKDIIGVVNSNNASTTTANNTSTNNEQTIQNIISQYLQSTKT